MPVIGGMSGRFRVVFSLRIAFLLLTLLSL